MSGAAEGTDHLWCCQKGRSEPQSLQTFLHSVLLLGTSQEVFKKNNNRRLCGSHNAEVCITTLENARTQTECVCVKKQPTTGNTWINLCCVRLWIHVFQAENSVSPQRIHILVISGWNDVTNQDGTPIRSFDRPLGGILSICEDPERSCGSEKVTRARFHKVTRHKRLDYETNFAE